MLRIEVKSGKSGPKIAEKITGFGESIGTAQEYGRY
jgi:hypothetical protein